MNPKPLIRAEQLTFRVPSITARDSSLLSSQSSLMKNLYLSRSRRSYITLLDDLSFTLEQGMRLGIMGKNGAGKSTLLRLLAGIYHPSNGQLTINGTAKGLFDVSLGMQAGATGLENIYLRGLQMGLTPKKIKTLLPEVIEFSELEEHMGKLFSTYSAGMKLRLAVSISTMIEPDILLLDEWIGAGDAEFRKKITERMNGMVSKSKGLILATHSEALMKKLCTHAMVLDTGRLAFFGTMDEADAFYKQTLK